MSDVNIVKMTSSEKTSARSGKIQYIAIHYTAGATSKKGTARANAQWYANKSNTTEASADFFVDDAEIVQYNPDPLKRYCWAVGGSKNKYTKGGRLYGVARNANSISIEVCSSNKSGKMTYANDPQYYFTDAVLENAVALTRYLMESYNIDIDHVIRHYDVTGKLCPGIIGWNLDSGSEAAWEEFRKKLMEEDDMDISKMTGADCAQIVNTANDYLATLPAPEWAQKELQEAVDMGITDGTRPMQLIPRYQAAIMAKRAAEKK